MKIDKFTCSSCGVSNTLTRLKNKPRCRSCGTIYESDSMKNRNSNQRNELLLNEIKESLSQTEEWVKPIKKKNNKIKSIGNISLIFGIVVILASGYFGVFFLTGAGFILIIGGVLIQRIEPWITTYRDVKNIKTQVWERVKEVGQEFDKSENE